MHKIEEVDSTVAQELSVMLPSASPLVVATWNFKSAGISHEHKWRFLEDQGVVIAAVQEAVPLGDDRFSGAQREVRPPKGNYRTGIATLKGREMFPVGSLAGGRAFASTFPDLELVIVSVHSYKDGYEGSYPAASAAILQEAVTLGDGVARELGLAVLIAGDLNASLEFDWADFRPPFRGMQSAGYRNLFCIQSRNCADREDGLCGGGHGKTYRRAAGSFCVDYLFGNDAAVRRLLDIRVMNEGFALSDHAPIVARLAMP